jgi:hypothetical protein
MTNEKETPMQHMNGCPFPQEKAAQMVKAQMNVIGATMNGKRRKRIAIFSVINSLEFCFQVCRSFYNHLSHPVEVKSDEGYIANRSELKYWAEVQKELMVMRDESYYCSGRCGMNYCEEHGCLEKKPNYPDGLPLNRKS